jgi:hypothetical protein
MRPDLHKVLTEQPRRGSNSRNLKTRVHFRDDDESREDRYSLPNRGKMVTGNRELGPHDESKDFTDKLGPLRRWLAAQVGRNWDRVYSEIKRAFPNTNKQNQHFIETHLLHEVECHVTVEKLRKGRRVYVIAPHSSRREPQFGELYVDPQTHVVMQWRWQLAFDALHRLEHEDVS